MPLPAKSEVYGWNSAGCLWFYPDAESWKSQLTIAGIKGYLGVEIRSQLTRELPVMFAAFAGANAANGFETGFYSVVRALFPHLEAIALLRYGKPERAELFMKEYLSKRNEKYGLYAELIHSMYRDGLTHTAMAKLFRRSDGVRLYWQLKLSRENHLVPFPHDSATWYLPFSLPVFYEDLLSSLDGYVAEFDAEAGRDALRTRFEEGFLRMATVYPVPGVAKNCADEIK